MLNTPYLPNHTLHELRVYVGKESGATKVGTLWVGYQPCIFTFSADCIDVHISNMVGPDEERQCRPVDPRHVERLKAQYKRSTTSLVVLAGMITEPDVDINRYMIVYSLRKSKVYVQVILKDFKNAQFSIVNISYEN